MAPLIGGAIGTCLYLIFIDWQLPDPDQPDNLSTPPSQDVNQKDTGEGKELKKTPFVQSQAYFDKSVLYTINDKINQPSYSTRDDGVELKAVHL